MVTVKAILILCLAFGLTAATEERKRRQAYDGNYNGAAQYRQPQGYQQQQPQGYQQQPQGYQQQSYGHQPAPQQYAPQQAHKPARPQAAPQEEEKEQGPHPLNLLLENSKFECGSKSDGYYADSGVGCQAFHYCVAGHKHSMMCPAGTVFHQVHLNCVPQDQDICNKADKFYFVNDYLNKPLEQKGPNNTVQYAHRYYPENYAVGDPFVPPQETQKQPPAATYGLGPAYREQQPAPAPHQGAYHPQAAYAQQAPSHHQQPAAPVHHAQNPAPYTPPAQAYQHRPAQHQPPAQAYQHRPAQPAHQQYGYGAQQAQAYNLQAQQAQRAYAQQQHQAVAPQQHLYGAGAGQRPRYA